MKKVEAYRVEIPIVATDEYSRELNKASKTIDDANKKIKDGVKAQDNLSKSAKDVAKAQDGISKSTRSASKGVEDVGKSAERAERSVSRTTRTFESFGSKIKSLQRAKANIEVAVKDNATRVLGRIRSTWDGFRRHPVTRITVFAVDRAMRILSGIRRSVLSIPTMITIGLSYVGIKSLGDATVGAAMNWEQYEVSMTHWLDGNIKQAKELTKWMGEFADITPYSSPELFPALTRAVSITDKDLDKSKRLLRIASDMAALTPDRTVEDAMQAIANSKMGNTVMLQGFDLDISKKQMDEMGGWDALVDELDKKFKGGAEKLSKTASGVLATLSGYRSSLMRSMGTGFLEPMKPRLDAINDWLANNQETWGRWKGVVKDAGEQFSEFAFSRAEKGFKYLSDVFIPANVEGEMWGAALADAEIPNLSFTAKLGIVYDDAKGAVGKWWSSSARPAIDDWWDETGSGVALEIGKSIGSGIMEGIKLGLRTGAGLFTKSWSDLFTNFKESGFSKETGKSALGALATTAGAAYLGKRLIYNPGRSVYRGGKRVKEWNDGRPKKNQSRQERWNESNEKRIERRLARGEKAAERKAAREALKTKRTTKIPKGSSKLLRRVPLLGTAMSGMSMIGASQEELPGLIGSIAGGIGGAKVGAMGGAAIGSVVPGIGTAIGGVVGGIGGGIAGAMGGEWIGENWEVIKEKATEAATWVGTQFTNAREYLSTTFFSGEWWSGKWNQTKDFATSTFFNLGWWSEQAGFIWGTLENTLFSGEWWMGKWDGVKSWTSEKWGEWTEIYDDAKTKIDETVFNSEWWLGKWDGVKGWTSEKWAEFGEIWSSARDAISSTLFSADWWSGKWGQVKSWASSAWSNITSGFSLGRSKASGGGGNSVTAYARGGIARSPHLGLVAEAGVPEAMIPWDGSSRSKALWQQTGEALGMFGGESSQSDGDAIVASSGGLSLSIGDINVGGSSNVSAEEILNLITPALYERIKAAIAKR